jgi:hypothetical protein
MAMNVTPTVLPYIPPRKSRAHEPKVFCVKWGEPTSATPTVYFRWFSRDSAAVNFLNSLTEQGIPARLTMKKG